MTFYGYSLLPLKLLPYHEYYHYAQEIQSCNWFITFMRVICNRKKVILIGQLVYTPDARYQFKTTLCEGSLGKQSVTDLNI